MIEVWKDIDGYEGLYAISSLGNVKSFYSSIIKILKPMDNGNGYKFVMLHKNGQYKAMLIHRLVANAFIPNPNCLSEVNHKDEVRTNNCVDNLEWCTHEYNNNYGNRNKRLSKSHKNHEKLSQKIYSVDENDNVEYFPSLREAERVTGIPHQNISNAINGKYQYAGKRKWFRNENSQITNND